MKDEAQQTRYSATADALRALLAAGPIPSAAAKARMAALGFTTKQIRLARERLRVVATRSGSGASMCSRWAMPTEGTNYSESTGAMLACGPEPGLEPDEIRRSAEIREGASAGISAAAEVLLTPRPRWNAMRNQSIAHVPFVPALSPDEQMRIARRVDFFIANRSIERDTATVVATKLIERDRRHSTEGSCLECQAYAMKALCRRGPSPVDLIWYCGSARRDGP